MGFFVLPGEKVCSLFSRKFKVRRKSYSWKMGLGRVVMLFPERSSNSRDDSSPANSAELTCMRSQSLK